MKWLIFATAALLAPFVAKSQGLNQEVKMCIEQSSNTYRVNSVVLTAIVLHESRGDPRIINRANNDGSVDYGAAGINSIHLQELSKYGIGPNELLDACTNIRVGAWHYAKKIRKYGNTWTAVGAYHSENPNDKEKYARLIYQKVALILNGR